jgi:anti-sigma factor RsiW
LIPSYLDGELSEARAAPLRKHLLDCQPCRAGAQGERNLKRWFAADASVIVPRGFAARVARRAFAGDAGEASFAGHVAGAGIEPRVAEERILRFVLTVTAAAALVVIALAESMRNWTLPSGTNLSAAVDREQISVEEALERLDRLNRNEALPARAPGVEARRP